MSETPPPAPQGGYGSGGQNPPPPSYGAPTPPPPPSYGAPQPGADFPGRTLGIVGLIVAFFANVIGLVISAIALSQSKKAGYKNGPALAGVIVGSVLTGISVIVIIVIVFISLTTSLAVLGVAAGAGSDDGPVATDPFDPGPTSEPGPTSSPGDDGSDTDVFDLVVGDCFDEQVGDTVVEVPVVDCATPHDWEVYTDFEVPDTADGAFPGDEAVDTAADDGCFAAFETFLGASYADTIYDYNYLLPTEDSWNEADDRLITCIIGDPSGKVTGTLEGAGTGAESGADSTLYSPR